MKHHVMVYMKAHNFRPGDFIPCEDCAEKGIVGEAVDVHHKRSRGIGGSKLRDDPSNLVALCRKHHAEYHGQNTIT